MPRVLVTSVAALMLSVVTVSAQSLPANNVELYAGLQGGYVEQEISGSFQRFANPAHPDDLPFDLSALDSQGSLFGLHVGFDVPLAGIFPPGTFIGIVGEYSKANLGEERTLENRSLRGKLARTFTVENELDWIASLRARIGYKTGPFAVFGTLGWSWTDYKLLTTSSCANATASTCASARWVDQPRSDSASATADDNGLAYGGGFIFDINSALRLTVEYVHHDVGGGTTMHQLAPHGAQQGRDVTTVEFDAIDVVQMKLSFVLN